MDFIMCCIIESDDCVDDLAKDLDDALRENFHYDYCRKLGQLEAVQIAACDVTVQNDICMPARHADKNWETSSPVCCKRLRAGKSGL